jgi:signal transduction histidine kinase
MDRLVEDVLEYGRLSHIEIKPAVVSLKEAIGRTLSQLDDRIQAANAEIIAHGPWPDVAADLQLLVQVLCHLLDNALTFVSAGTQPRIRIRAESLESAVRLWIEDNGVGIEPRYQGRIFDLFETINPKDPINSTGVGLAIVKRAMVRMSGRVGVDSKPGSGSRFWIELPLARKSE